MRRAVEFGIGAGKERHARPALGRLKQNVAPDGPGDVIALEGAEELVPTMFARARRVDRDPAQAGREELRPAMIAMIAAEVASLLPRRRRLEGLPEPKISPDI
jgi:hypothetical protein